MKTQKKEKPISTKLSKTGQEFNKKFRATRKEGKATLSFKGKSYTTKLK